MIRFCTTFTLFIVLASSLKSQTQSDTLFNYITKTPVTIDGQATEECWANAGWHSIDQVWIPFNQVMQEGDFSGRYKVAWDALYLYVLVEVIDDSLSDDHAVPTQNWWDDDCLEVFIDENRSKGNHELNNNAFAYHVSLFYDAIDLNASGQGVNYKDNIQVVMDTIGENTYQWEFAIKNYSAAFNINNPEASRVTLEPNKKMGFAIAYCDNDETLARENFIGSMVMSQATANDMYKNANYFGLMVLVDPDYVGIPMNNTNNHTPVYVYPIPTYDKLTIDIKTTSHTLCTVTISTITGNVITNENFTGNQHTLNLKEIPAGIYILKVSIDGISHISRIIKE